MEEPRSKTYFEATANLALAREYSKLQEGKRTRVAIIGGGLAGLCTAYHLAARNVETVLIEAGKVGQGASGRNAGFLCNDWELPYYRIVEEVGLATAKDMQDWAEDAKADIRGVMAANNIPLTHGTLEVCYPDKDRRTLRKEATLLGTQFGLAVKYIHGHDISRFCDTNSYIAGILHHDSFQFNPVDYVHALAGMVSDSGVKIYEQTPAMKIEGKIGDFTITTKQDLEIHADEIVLACEKDVDHSDVKINRRSIIDYVMVSEPLDPAVINRIVKNPYESSAHPPAVFDWRDAATYYRVLPDQRLLWGGHFGDVDARPVVKYLDLLRERFRSTYPKLPDFGVDYTWHGKIEQNMQGRLPRIGELREGLWLASGFGGEGLVATMTAGKLIATGIKYDDQRHNAFDAFMPPDRQPVARREMMPVEYKEYAMR